MSLKVVGASPEITFSQSADVTLFRGSGAGFGATLQSNNAFYFGSNASNATAFIAGAMPTDGSGTLLVSRRSGETQYRFYVTDQGSHSWGPGGTTPADTNLYRSAASTLKTDGALYSAAEIQARVGAAYQVQLGYTGGYAGITLGTAGDTLVYRSAAYTLNTNNDFIAGGAITANNGAAAQILLGSDGRLYFGPAGDTDLYRSGANALKTDGILNAVGGLQINGVAVSAGGGEVKIADTTLGTAAASFDFTSIPATYSSLRLVVYLRDTIAQIAPQFVVRINGDSASNYEWWGIVVTGTTMAVNGTGSMTSFSNLLYYPGASADANVFAVYEFIIPNYAGTTGYKSYSMVGGVYAAGTANNQFYTTGYGAWKSTAALNRITVTSGGTTFAVGSRAILYGSL
jgi:hypothetical protein